MPESLGHITSILLNKVKNAFHKLVFASLTVTFRDILALTLLQV